MNLLLIILAIIIVYLLGATLVIVITFWLTSFIRHKFIKYSLRTISFLIAPFWLYIDMVIGLPLLAITCNVYGGTKIYEPFEGNAFSVSDDYFTKDYEISKLASYFYYDGYVGKMASQYNLAVIKNYTDSYAKFWLADNGDPSCITFPDDLKKRFGNYYENHCVAVNFISGIYNGYYLDTKPFRFEPGSAHVNNKNYGFAMNELGIRLYKNKKLTAEANTFYFQKWLGLPTLSEKADKKYFCDGQNREHDYMKDFFRELMKSRNKNQ